MAPYFKAINLTGDLYLTDTRLRYSDDMLTNNRYQQLKKHTKMIVRTCATVVQSADSYDQETNTMPI